MAQTRSKHARTAAAEQRRKGVQAFAAGKFAAAIAAWEHVADGDAAVTAALAEAYFRRGLQPPINGEQQHADLQQAVTLRPAEPRYMFHLARSLHAQGDLPNAMQQYEAVLQRDPTFAAAALLLAVAAFQRDPAAVPALAPAVDTAAVLSPVQAILQRQPYTPADDSTPVARFWQGLSLLEHDPQQAEQLLHTATPLPYGQLRAVQHVYLGNLAARRNDPATALEHWQAAWRTVTYRSEWLRQNLLAVFIPHLQMLLAGGDDAALADAVTWAVNAKLDHTSCDLLVVQGLDHLAHAALATGQVAVATTHWETARTVIGQIRSAPSARTLLHNLARSYEMQERWHEAADTWRAMLRTRPRKQPATPRTDDPGYYTDEQWAWVQRRVIVCYQQAGAPGEAVKVFRQALKRAPDDLDIRIQLADALLANEQEQASINELHRILERDSNHVTAHLRLAEIYISSDLHYWDGASLAEHSLRAVLAIQPDRADVRRQIGRTLLTRGGRMLQLGLHEQAEAMLREGWEFAPEDYRFPLFLARLALITGDVSGLPMLLEQVIARADDNAQVYIQVIETWLVFGNLSEAQRVLGLVHQKVAVSLTFYFDLLHAVLAADDAHDQLGVVGKAAQVSRDVPDSTPAMLMARDVTAMIISLQPDAADVRFELASVLMSHDTAQALEHATVGVQLLPDEPGGWVLLGVLQGVNNMLDEARATLRYAAQMARRQGQNDMADQAESLRAQVGHPFFHMLVQSVGVLPDDDGIDEDGGFGL